ncbi:MAG: type VI secretion system baseplate subunit TssG [Myxococcales bacterium]|nr:type VI secretion system baseplate subunit TssG [Myxococcales bacterium]
MTRDRREAPPARAATSPAPLRDADQAERDGPHESNACIAPPPADDAWLEAHRRDPSRSSLLALVTALRRRSTPTAADISLRQRAALGFCPKRHISVLSPTADPDAPNPARTYLELADPRRPGLVGTATPLPLALVEAAASASAGGRRLRGFLDLFHGVLLDLEIDALSHLRPPQSSDDAARWEARLLAAAGLDAPTTSLPRAVRLRLLPLLLAARAPSPALLARAVAVALADITSDLEVSAAPLEDRPAPQPSAPRRGLGSAGARLGAVALGDHLRVPHGLRLTLRGLPRAALERFVPGADGRQRIAELVAKIAPPGAPWELELIPAKAADSGARLGESRLGATWLGRTHPPRARSSSRRASPRPRDLLRRDHRR